MIRFYLLLISFCIISIVSAQDFQLQAGDLLFQDLDCGSMCDAIESVTQGYDKANFSHVGIAVEIADAFYVLEAISVGVTLTPIEKFLARGLDTKGNPKVMVGRLKSDYQSLIKPAIHRGMTYLGKEYDGVFDIENDQYYCSELVYEAFKIENKSIFKLYPMTFKPIGLKGFFPVWVDYYKGLNLAIPEGEAGLNPGGVSRSSYLEVVHWYGEVSRRIDLVENK